MYIRMILMPKKYCVFALPRIASFAICVLLFYQYLHAGESLSGDSHQQFLAEYHLTIDPNKNLNNEHQEHVINNDNNMLFSRLADNRSFEDNISFYSSRLTQMEELSLSQYTNEVKRILVWTRHYGQMPGPFHEEGTSWFRDSGCPVRQCEVVPFNVSFDHNTTIVYWKNSSLPVEDFDAVVFHDPHWHDFTIRPLRRSPHQLYIWWSQESPGYHSFPKLWNEAADFFNMTMSYRWDSDITIPYGFIRRLTDSEILSNKVVNKKTNYAEGKSKLIAWFVGHCDTSSKRLECVKRLQNHIDVNIYGKRPEK